MQAFRTRVEVWAQAAGLLATAWVVWATSIAPFWQSQHLIRRIGWGIALAIGALGWSAILAIALLFIFRQLNGDTAPESARPSAAIWFAPATILLLQLSPIGLAAGLVL